MTEPEVAAAKRELRRIAKRIPTREAQLAADYARRTELFRILVAAGESMAECGRLAGVTRVAVRSAVKTTA